MENIISSSKSLFLFLSDAAKFLDLTIPELYRAVAGNYLLYPARNAENKVFWPISALENNNITDEVRYKLENNIGFFVISINDKEIDQQEQLGSKEKFWCYIGGNDSKWLFKFTQEHTGQHWSEKIAAEIAEALGMQHAPVELAEFQDRFGSISESIARNGRQLIHGNQLLSGLVTGYNSEATYQHKDHTIENIVLSLEKYFKKEESIKINTSQLFGYFLFDCLIGNTDRHHENWAISQREIDGKLISYIAPSFDHASSLGRELRDRDSRKSREKILQNRTIANYAQRARGERWSPFFGQGDKLSSGLNEDGFYGQGYAETVCGRVQVTGCAGGDPWGTDAGGTGFETWRASDDDRPMEAPGDRRHGKPFFW